MQVKFEFEYSNQAFSSSSRGCCGRDCMVVEFTTACVIIAFHHWSFEFESRSQRGVLITTFSD